MTRNEQIASIMLEAAELLKNDTEVLNEDASYTNSIISKIKNSMNFTESEKDKALDWLDSNSDDLDRAVEMMSEDYDEMEKRDKIFLIAFIVTIPTAIIPFILMIIYAVVSFITNDKMSKSHRDLKAIKRKILQVDKSKLTPEQLSKYEKILDKIGDYEDRAYSTVKISK